MVVAVIAGAWQAELVACVVFSCSLWCPGSCFMCDLRGQGFRFMVLWLLFLGG